MHLELSDLLNCSYAKDADGPDCYDCWNLCREVYRRAGRSLPRYTDYLISMIGKDHVKNIIVDVKKDINEFVKIDNPEYLAIVLLNLGRDLHMGIVLEEGRFIHVMRKTKVSIERLDSPRIKGRIEGYYRYVANNQT